MIDLSDRRQPLAAPLPITIALFGGFQAERIEQPAHKFRASKSRALLAYLLLARGQPILRTTLTSLLWDGYLEKSARASLRQVLADIRQFLRPFDLLHADYHTVQLRNDPAIVDCDVLRFDELLAACERHVHPALDHCPSCRNRLQQAVALYTGAFLQPFPPVDSAPFTAWLESQRQLYATRLAQSQAWLERAEPLQRQSRSNLPTPLTPLIGRAAALVELAGKLHHPVYRCLTLIGPGGAGKTRLALALAAQQATAFHDGVWFVDCSALTPLTSGSDSPPSAPAAGDASPAALSPRHDRLATVILQACGLTLQGAKHPTAQLLAYLQDKALLFLLDNFEQVSDDVALLAQLLAQAPAVRFLVTSRHRLALQGQQIYQVEGLPWPTAAGVAALPTDEIVARYGSVQLFLERATLFQPGLAVNGTVLAAIAAICRVVEGLPLALELSAPLLESQPLEEIAPLIRSNYQLLHSRFQDLPPRQRSAQAVLHTAWQLLTPREAATLVHCAVFQGGFTLAAAQTVALATVADLDAVIYKSLLQREPTKAGPRYRLHELVRQFAAEQLAQQEADAQVTRDRHVAYYLGLAATWQPSAAAEERFRTVIQTDLENVEQAWAWALTGDQVGHLAAAVDGLIEYYEMAGAFYAAEALLLRSVAQVRVRLLAASPEQAAQLLPLLAALLVQLAYISSIGLANQVQAHAAATEALALAEALEDVKLLVRSYHALAAAAYGESNFSLGQELSEKALLLIGHAALPLSLELRRAHAMCLSAAGMHAAANHDFATALRYLPQALTLAQEIDDTRKALLFRNQLGIVYRDSGDLEQALYYVEENRIFVEQHGDPYNGALNIANLGLLHMFLGNDTVALPTLEEGGRRFAALGEARIANDCLAMIGALWWQQGNAADAAATCRRVLAQPQTQITAQQVAWLTLGDLYRAQNDWIEAHAAYTQLAAISTQPDAAGVLLLAKGGLAVLLLAQNKGAAALVALEELLPQFSPNHFDPFFSAPRFLLFAYQILAANQDGRAPLILQQAWQIVMDSAAKINDLHLRTSFLTNIPVHRQLAQLMGAL